MVTITYTVLPLQSDGHQHMVTITCAVLPLQSGDDQHVVTITCTVLPRQSGGDWHVFTITCTVLPLQSAFVKCAFMYKVPVAWSADDGGGHLMMVMAMITIGVSEC